MIPLHPQVPGCGRQQQRVSGSGCDSAAVGAGGYGNLGNPNGDDGLDDGDDDGYCGGDDDGNGDGYGDGGDQAMVVVARRSAAVPATAQFGNQDIITTQHTQQQGQGSGLGTIQGLQGYSPAPRVKPTGYSLSLDDLLHGKLGVGLFPKYDHTILTHQLPQPTPLPPLPTPSLPSPFTTPLQQPSLPSPSHAVARIKSMRSITVEIGPVLSSSSSSSSGSWPHHYGSAGPWGGSAGHQQGPHNERGADGGGGGGGAASAASAGGRPMMPSWRKATDLVLLCNTMPTGLESLQQPGG